MFQILNRQRLNDAVTSITVSAPLIAKKAKAGQFVIIRVDSKGERIPLTVSEIDKENGSITLVVQALGYTTKKLSALQTGEYITDVVGPLGNPTEFGKPKKAVVVGGGVGCAISLPQAKALKEMGVETVMIAGFRNKEAVILEDSMKQNSDSLYIATDDGSYGEKGFVTDILERVIKEGGCDLVVAVGPVPMMKAICNLTKDFGIKTIVSLNPIMIDGTGMCGGCRVNVGGKIKFACVDGPDFDGHEVDFAELALRNNTYREEQDHICRLGVNENG